MIALRPGRVRRAVALLAALGLGWPVRAAEEPAAPPAPAGNRPADTLEAAREELRRLRMDRADQSPAPGGGPQLVPPEWHGSGRPAVPLRPPGNGVNAPASAATSPNWLLDAMQTPGRFSGGSRVPGERVSDLAGEGEPARRPDGRAGAATGRIDPRAAVRRAAGEPERVDSPAVINPLTDFLDDWMSPQDYALLGPGLAPGPLARPEGGPAGAMTVGRGGLSGLSTAGGFPGGILMAPPVPAPANRGASERENPFLTALQAPAGVPPAAVLPPRPPAATPSIPAVTGSASPHGMTGAPPPPPARVPEFARPGDDTKYFKPLKRF